MGVLARRPLQASAFRRAGVGPAPGLQSMRALRTPMRHNPATRVTPLGRQIDRAPAELEHFRAILQAYMDKKGLRSTDQRRLIVETFFRAENHVSIEELLAQGARQGPSRRLRHGLPYAQAPGRVRSRERAALRRRAHALRAGRRRHAPRPLHLRRVRRHRRVRGAAHRGAAGGGGAEARLPAARRTSTSSMACARAVRPSAAPRTRKSGSRRCSCSARVGDDPRDGDVAFRVRGPRPRAGSRRRRRSARREERSAASARS